MATTKKLKPGAPAKARTLLQLAAARHKKLMKLVGSPVLDRYGEPTDRKVNLYMDNPVDQCVKMGELWDIPQYCNGSTRREVCLFLLPPTAVADGAYAYSVSDNSEMEAKFKKSPLYDREKVLASESRKANLFEVVWSYDFGPPRRAGQHYYWVKEFWFGVRVNGKLLSKAREIKHLSVPEHRQKCYCCERTRDVSAMTHTSSGWMCTGTGRPYEKCPE